MVKFKDIMKKAKEMAEKAVDAVKMQWEFERLLSDFDEYVANTIADILQNNGYRGMGQGEAGDSYRITMAIEDEEKVKHIIERDIMRHYSPKDREKILSKIPDRVEIYVTYTRKGTRSPILTTTGPEDVKVSAKLYYFVERKGGFFSKVKRDERQVSLGGFTFRSSQFINAQERDIDADRLRQYLEQKLKGLGLI
ncbi:MAG: hypothetical protein F7C35_05660 [Desulfurococcales archaeon]|nr:hypothetical protein [Desulfurococcales archaeon]